LFKFRKKAFVKIAQRAWRHETLQKKRIPKDYNYILKIKYFFIVSHRRSDEHIEPMKAVRVKKLN